MAYTYKQTKAGETKAGVTSSELTAGVSSAKAYTRSYTTSAIATVSGTLHQEIVDLNSYVDTVSGTLQSGIDSKADVDHVHDYTTMSGTVSGINAPTGIIMQSPDGVLWKLSVTVAGTLNVDLYEV